MDHKGKPNANYIADLPLYHRTPAALFENQEFLGDVRFAVWYVRLRDKRQTNRRREMKTAAIPIIGCMPM